MQSRNESSFRRCAEREENSFFHFWYKLSLSPCTSSIHRRLLLLLSYREESKKNQREEKVYENCSSFSSWCHSELWLSHSSPMQTLLTTTTETIISMMTIFNIFILYLQCFLFVGQKFKKSSIFYMKIFFFFFLYFHFSSLDEVNL